MAQPPLSRSIRQAGERTRCGALRPFAAGGPTHAAGAVLLDEAHGTSGPGAAVATLARRARDGGLGTLRAGVPPDTTAAALSRCSPPVRSDSPGRPVDLQEVTTEEQLRLLSSGGLDVGARAPPRRRHRAALGPGSARSGGRPAAHLAADPTAGSDARRLSPATIWCSFRGLSARLVRPDLDVCRAAGFVPGRSGTRQPGVPARAGDGGLRSRLRPGAGGAQGAPRGLAAAGGPAPGAADLCRTAEAVAARGGPRFRGDRGRCSVAGHDDRAARRGLVGGRGAARGTGAEALVRGVRLRSDGSVQAYVPDMFQM